MKKLILLLAFCLTAKLGFSQIYFTFDSLANPPYICQASAFDVEVFGKFSSGITLYSSSNVVISNDTIYVKLYCINGPGGTATPYPLYHKETIQAPPIFGPYKIVVQGFYNNQLHRTLTSTIAICSGVAAAPKTLATQPQISVFPNPGSDYLHIRLPENKTGLHLTLTDACGKRVLNAALEPGRLQTQLPLLALPAGLYLLQVAGPNQHFSEKIICR